MRLRFSPEVFRFQRFGGVSRYVTELHQGLLRRGVDSEIFAGLHINSILAGVPHVRGMDVSFARPERARQAVTKVLDPALCRVWRSSMTSATIYHNTWYSETVPRGPRLAVTVHDLIHDLFPDEVPGAAAVSRRRRRWCLAADVVFTDSEVTRQDLLERVPMAEDRVIVVHLGVTTVEPDPAAVTPSSPFVLYVGDRRSRYKNFDTLLRATSSGGSAGEVRVVCFGEPFDRSELDRLHELGVSGRFVAVQGDDRVLAAHYSSASALVYPSRYEGFGLPAVEAMAHGCPVVAASAGSLPEVIGDAGIFFDPDDVEACNDAINRVLEDHELAADLVIRGSRRCRDFTWDATVDRTLEAYRSL